jgi:GTP-binding protein HflX
VAAADLLVHVIDASNPDHERHRDASRSVLHEVDAGDVPTLDVYSKIDATDDVELARLRARHPEAIFLSGRTGEGKEELIEVMASRLALDTHRVTLEFDESNETDRRRLASLYRHAHIVSHIMRDNRVSVEADVPRRLLDRFTAVNL